MVNAVPGLRAEGAAGELVSPQYWGLCLLALLGGCAIDDREGLLVVDGPPTYMGEAAPPAGGGSLGMSATNSGAVAPTGSEGGGAGIVGTAITLDGEVALLEFGDAEVGTAGASLLWRVSLQGQPPSGEAPTLTSSNPLDFVVQGDCAQLPTQGFCELMIQFQPRAGGARTGRLELALGGGQAARVELIGNAQVRLTLERAGVGQGNVTSTASDAISCGTRCSALFNAGERVSLDARPVDGTNTLLSGWEGGADCFDPSQRCTVLMTESTTVRAVFSPIVNNLVFVSSRAYPSNLGGVAPYDAACNELASAAGINNSARNGYFAGMATAAASLRERLSAAPVQGWVRMDGRPFAVDIAALFDADQVYHPVRYTELGETRSVTVMTGAETDGSTGVNCSDWSTTSAEASMLAGFSLGGPFSWLNSNSGPCSEEALQVLCFGRNGSAPAPAAPQEGKLIWATAEPYLPGTTTPDEHCQRSVPAGVSSARAFVADLRRSGADTLDPTALYVRLDGQAVGTGEHLATRLPLTGIWQMSDGVYITREHGISVWSGQFQDRARVGTLDSTCGDWRSTTGSGMRGIATTAGSDFWGAGTQPCDEPARLYCVEL